jgi:hypothetical protein
MKKSIGHKQTFYFLFPVVLRSKKMGSLPNTYTLVEAFWPVSGMEQN